MLNWIGKEAVVNHHHKVPFHLLKDVPKNFPRAILAAAISWCRAANSLRNQSVMKAMIETQELARRFNEDEAVWRSYEHKRALRRLLGSRSPIAGEMFWIISTGRRPSGNVAQVQAIGFFQP